MTDYERGFVEGLQAACLFAESKHGYHRDNAQKLKGDDAESALNCAIVLGNLASDIKQLGVSVRRGEMDPAKIAQANRNYWWAREDGQSQTPDDSR